MSCDKKMTFEECELAILRQAVDSVDKIEGEELLRNPEVKTIIEVVEEFLKKKNVFVTVVQLLMRCCHRMINSMTQLLNYQIMTFFHQIQWKMLKN